MIWNIISSVSALLLCIIAYFQLRDLARSSRINAILNLEAELHQRRAVLEKASIDLQLESRGANGKLYEDAFNSYLESYLNAVDRICYCILKDYLKDREWKSEYFNLIIYT
jgi:hypothetical protein